MLPVGTEETLFLSVTMGCLGVRRDGSVWRIARRFKSRWDGSISILPLTYPHRIDAVVGIGYRHVKVMIDGHQTSTPAHRLVWRVFHGPIPLGLTINHRNGDRADNRLINLELATYAEQSRHMIHVLKHGHVLNQNGEANSMAKLYRAAVREIRRRRAAGEKLLVLAVEFGVTDRAISKIARGDRWGFLG